MVDWDNVDKVFLDMDGTLLDLHFDNHFWLQYVPERYAHAHAIPLEAARAELHNRYKDLEGTLEWYCVDHWSRTLGLDIALLKEETDHLIAIHPQVLEFLEALGERDRRRVLVTNAHQKSIAIKMEKTNLAGHLDRIVCSHNLGVPKESPEFWPLVQEIEPFDKDRTLFVDDSPVVLQVARDYGFRHLLGVLRPDSKAPPRVAGDFPAIDSFADLLPGLRA